ncbi:MAG TPA: DUF3618 domain-containing protein [Dongiaceae bacterium]|nr:DUF3618 domain-containing protein [Dongiaceae bacterium]
MGKDSSEIRREIEETRARMGDTVEALGYKADVPSRVKDAVNDRVETVKGTIGDVVESVKDTVTGATGAVGDALGGASGKVGSALGGAKRGMSDTLAGASDTLRDTTGRVRETTSRVGETTSNVRSTVQNTLSNTVGSVAGKLPNPQDVTGAARRGVGIVQENPLGLALGALAVGFLAGLAAPVTDLEREKVGPLRDELVGRAKDLGADALEHGKQVLQETAQAALGAVQQSAQEHGEQVLSEAKGDTVHGQQQNQNGAQDGDKRQGADGRGASSAGMPSDTSQGGGLRGETLMSGGTGSQTAADKGRTSSEYGVLLDEDRDTLEPGSPGTSSP